MEHFIIGTAGHVDHGKTALIRALTGRETDNLKEEKERGISIDLGFTYMELSDGSRAELPDICRGWEMLRVSAKNGQGIERLKQTIEKDHDGLDILMMFIRRDNSYINIGNQSIIRRSER